MSLKTFKPYTKTTRGTVLTSREGLWKGKPHKPLTSAINSSKGRNNNGRITSRNHGGGHKHKYRQIDFYRKKINIINKRNRIKTTRGKKVKIKGYKKAIITLKKGQNIDLATGI